MNVVLDILPRLCYNSPYIMPQETVNRSIEIRRLPVSTDRLLNAIAKIRGTTKTSVICEALNEYVERHRGEVEKYVRTM